MPLLLHFLKHLPAHELERKRGIISRYWLRRIQHQKTYEAAMNPIRKELEHLGRMKFRLRQQPQNGRKPERQKHQEFEARRTGGASWRGDSTAIANGTQVLHDGSTDLSCPYRKVSLSRPLGPRRHYRSYSVAISPNREHYSTTARNDNQEPMRSERLQARKEDWMRKQDLQKSCGPWENFVQLVEEGPRERSTLAGIERSLRQREYELASATETSWRVAAWKVQREQMSLEIKRQTLQLELHGKFLLGISRMLRAAPFDSLRRLYWLFMGTAQEFRKSLKTYHILRILRTESRHLIHRYRRLSIRPSCITESVMITDNLWYMINHEIEWPSGSCSARMAVTFKSFLAGMRAFREVSNTAQETLHAIRLRRTPTSEVERVFDAVHHRFTHLQSFGKDIMSLVQGTVERLSRFRRSSFFKPISRRRDAILDHLYRLDNAVDEAANIYDGDYLLIHICRLELMAPDELQRRSDQAKAYWVRYWQTTSETEKREKEIEQFRLNARKQRNELRATMRGLAKKMGLGRCVDYSNERAHQVPRYTHVGYKKYKKGRNQKYHKTSGHEMP